MKRIVVSLIAILVIVVFAVLSGILYSRAYVEGFEGLLDELDCTQQKEAVMDKMIQYYWRHSAIVCRIVPLSRMEEIETLLYKLNAYVKKGDEKETLATSEELRARVKMIYFMALWR